MFKAELWNPDRWADLFVRAGAKYVVPTSKHHEGYTLWPNAQSWNWNAVDVGPEIDLINDLFVACRKRGLHAGAYFSLFEWFNPLYIGSKPHTYVDQVMLPQLFDLVKRYQPDVIWTDGGWMQTSTFWNSTYFLSWLFNNAPNKDVVAVNDRWGSDTRGKHGGFYTAEYSNDYWLNHKWEANRGVDVNSYGYNRNSQAGNYSSSLLLVEFFVRTVAFGGNLLLDIGPARDGSIPVVFQERLLDMGAWLQVNGEAIYGSRKWINQSETATLFYTFQPTTQNVYAITTRWPKSDTFNLCIPKPTAQTTVTLLGTPSYDISYTVKDNCMVLKMPPLTVSQLPCKYSWTFRLTNLAN